MMELTESDQQILAKMQLARLMKIAAPLRSCVCLLDLEYCLNIHCPYPSDVDNILAIEVTLKELCRVVLGCCSISLWFANECVWQVELPTNETIALESEIIADEETDMTTATVEHLAIDEIVKQTAETEILPELDLVIDREIAAYTASPEFQNTIQTRVKTRLQGLLSGWNTNGNGAVATAEPTVNGTVVPEKPPLAISTNYTSTLVSALRNYSDDPKAQSAMLTQIRRKSKKGTEFLEGLIAQYPEEKQAKARAGFDRPSVMDAVRSKLTRK